MKYIAIFKYALGPKYVPNGSMNTSREQGCKLNPWLSLAHVTRCHLL